jgi:RimJ/RimL family protein N-acetyltransferase
VTLLRGERVVLRALAIDELDELIAGRAKVADMPKDTSPGARDRLRRRVENSGRFADGWLDLAIEVEGRLVGDIDARRWERATPPGNFEIGLSFFDLADRGRGYGSEAVSLLTGHLFDAHEAERVQAGTWVENTAMRRVLENVGFAFEGIMRAFMPSVRGRDDYALYAITRADWSARAG